MKALKEWGPYLLFSAIVTAVLLVFSIGAEAVMRGVGYEDPVVELEEEVEENEEEDLGVDEEGESLVLVVRH